MRKMISVIMPIKNGERHLLTSIQSLINQSFEDFELLIINDGSTDQTKDIILSFNDKRIVYLENNNSQGITKCLNKCIYLSKGEYLARMDCDDIALTNRFHEQIEFLQLNPSMDIVGSYVKIIYDEESGKGIENLEIRHPLSDEEIKIKLLEYNCLCHPSVMMRRKSLKDLNLFYDKDAMHAEDYKLWIDAALSGLKIGNIPKPLLEYRVHSSQTSFKNHRLQQYVSDEIKMAYATHFFSEVINGNEDHYLRLINAKTYERYTSNEIEMSTNLARKLKNLNLIHSFFDDGIFIDFLQDRIEFLECLQEPQYNGNGISEKNPMRGS